MEDNSEGGPHENGPVVEPWVTREHLKKTWIGIGAALEWIALRGQPIPQELYRAREDEADEVFVATLADLPPEIAESVVRGVETGGADELLVPVKSGIWRQTATSDANDAGQPFRLIATDEQKAWEGIIVRVSARSVQEGGCPGYERLQIRSAFILEKWPEHTLDLEPVPLGPAAALADVRRMIETVIAMVGDEMAPISQREMLTLLKRCLPNARRTQVRDTYAELMPAPKPGPKGARDPDRQRHIEELGQKLIAAQLHN